MKLRVVQLGVRGRSPIAGVTASPIARDDGDGRGGPDQRRGAPGKVQPIAAVDRRHDIGAGRKRPVVHVATPPVSAAVPTTVLPTRK